MERPPLRLWRMKEKKETKKKGIKMREGRAVLNEADWEERENRKSARKEMK